MTRFHSHVNTGSEEYSNNHRDMSALVSRLQDICQRCANLSDKSLPRFEKRGQLLPRERLSRLLDPGMPFLELHNVAGYLTDTHDPDKSVPGCNCISGIGFTGAS